MSNKVIILWWSKRFNFYKRERLSEEPIEFQLNEENFCIHLGLHFVCMRPDLQLFNTSFFKKINWRRISQRTIYLCLIRLLESGQVSLTQFEDKKSFFFSLISYKSRGYYLTYNHQIKDNDSFTHLILQVIYKTQKKKLRFKNIASLIDIIIDQYLGDELHANPSREFVLEILQKYSVDNSWVAINHKKKLFGIYRKRFLTIDESKKNQIIESHTDFEKHVNALEKKSLNLVNFRDRLFSKIQRDLNKRDSSDVAD